MQIVRVFDPFGYPIADLDPEKGDKVSIRRGTIRILEQKMLGPTPEQPTLWHQTEE